MNIALMAHDRRKELMVQFCIAYCGILAGHDICATNTTGRLVSEATGLPITLYLSCHQGGSQQIGSRIAYNELDMVLYFCDPHNVEEYQNSVMEIARLCDQKNVPFASNIATAEVLIHGLKRGDFDWRDIVNPKKK
ncbi:MAG: methylglyoxal synthase [Oscillospiraceae bacterium]|nr:methylglyoxal synthase [Oscillospiraceae bacterium]